MTYRCSKPICSREYHQDSYQPGLHCVCGALIIQDLRFRLSILKNKSLVEERTYSPSTYLEIGRFSSSSTQVPDLDLAPHLDGQKTVSKSHLTLLLNESGQIRVALASQKNPIFINKKIMKPGNMPQVLDTPLEIKVCPTLTLQLEQM